MTHKYDSTTHQESTSEYHDTPAGWHPSDKWAKVRDRYRKEHPETLCRQSMFKTRGANECVKAGGADKRQTDLFGNMWRTGEVALLFGETGVGKSVLAMQMAESIARGLPALSEPGAVATRAFGSKFGKPHSALRNREVLYLDFEHSDSQFNERYSCPSPIPGKLPVKYRFSTRLRRTRFGDLEIPDAFQGNLARYFQHSLNLTLEDEPAEVIVIDNLAWLDPRATGTAAAVRRMRSLKLYAVTNGVSILVLHSSPPCLRGVGFSSPPARGGVDALRGRGGGSGRGGSSGLSIQHSALRIYEAADSVFALGRTTFDPGLRYIKHLKSNSAQITHDASNVLVYQLGRSEGPARVRSPHVSKGSALIPPSAISSQVSSLSSPVLTGSSSIHHSPFDIRHSDGPFLGFTNLGTAAEFDLIRDYEREFLDEQKREQQRLKRLNRSSREILVDGVIDGSYARYLKG